jgi:hypothetical protein
METSFGVLTSLLQFLFPEFHLGSSATRRVQHLDRLVHNARSRVS